LERNGTYKQSQLAREWGADDECFLATSDSLKQQQQQQQQSAKSQADSRPFGLDAAGAALRLLMLAYRGTEIARAGKDRQSLAVRRPSSMQRYWSRRLRQHEPPHILPRSDVLATFFGSACSSFVVANSILDFWL